MVLVIFVVKIMSIHVVADERVVDGPLHVAITIL